MLKTKTGCPPDYEPVGLNEDTKVPVPVEESSDGYKQLIIKYKPLECNIRAYIYILNLLFYILSLYGKDSLSFLILCLDNRATIEYRKTYFNTHLNKK